MNNDSEIIDIINDVDIISFIITTIIGIIVGLIIGYLIFKDIKYIGPNSNDVVKNIYYDNYGKKYKLVPHITICPINYSMNKLHDPLFTESHSHLD